MNKESKIAIFGASGMVGSAVVRKLREQGYGNLLTDRIDLTNQWDVNDYFRKHNPEYVFLVAGRVGGIKANNTYKAEFIYTNLMIAANVIHTAYLAGVKKLLYTGSSCIYPKFAPNPISESSLLTNELEPTNEAYALAKISGIKLCQFYRDQYGCNFISAMPTNSFGPQDHYDLENSHVLPALLRKIITTKQNGEDEVEIWGTGNARREFLYVDDMADALIFLMNKYDSPEIINVGTGEDISIRDLANLIKDIVDFDGYFRYNMKMDGVGQKVLNVSKINNLGWKHKTGLEEGIKKTIETLKEDWYKK